MLIKALKTALAATLAAGICWPITASAGEAPSLATLVAAGTLPALEKRLPEHPFVVTPIEKVGQYGDELRLANKRGDVTHFLRLFGYEGLFSWDLAWRNIIPNIAESYDVNATATEYVIHLRKGLKWSDGSPFTASDIEFVFNDLLKNKEWLGTRPDFATDAAAYNAETVDDDTLKVTFAKPNGLFIFQLANVGGTEIALYNKAYCSKFHIKYNPNADADAKALGLSDWRALFELKCSDIYGDSRFMNPERPVMEAWAVEKPADATAQVGTFKRNAYYFKVDTAGNQLPYLDQLTFVVFNDPKDMTLAALNGEVDFQDRHINPLSSKPVYLENAEKGGFHLFETIPASMNVMALMFNQTVEDPVLRKIFNNKDFRIAMSQAIDRQEIIDAVLVGQGEPYQAAPRPESKYYDEAYAKQYTEYSPEKANQLLDSIGLDKKDGEGFRLRPDGERLRLTVETTPTVRPEWPDMLELVREQWRKVGVDLQVKVVDRNLIDEHRRANKHELLAWLGEGGLDVIADPRFYMIAQEESAFGVPWAYWFLDPKNPAALEPPANVRKQRELFAELTASPKAEDQDRLMKEILAIGKDDFYVMGIALTPKGYGIVKNNVHNVPVDQPFAWSYPTPGPMQYSQLFKQ